MKILLLDIETAPNIVHTWGLYNQNVGINQIQQPGYVLCWAAKWYKDETMHFGSRQDGQKRMLRPIHKLMTDADAIVHYNGKKFDVPMLHTEFIQQGMQPPAPSKEIDLLLTARDQFRWPSNKLDFVSRALRVGHKVQHEGHELWTKCMAGDKRAWSRMRKYNEGDVLLLEKLYTKFLPWIKRHPLHGTFADGEPVCPNCGGYNLTRQGYARTVVQKYARLKCNDCGKWCRSGINELHPKLKKEILRPDLG